MRKAILIAVMLAAIPVIALSAPPKGKRPAGGKAPAKAGGTMNVQVREVAVKSTPNYMGASAGTLSYGAQVNVLGEQGNWYQIEKPAGWLPKSALTKRKVAVNPDAKFAHGTAKHDEVALAGKGFNPDVEAQYKRDNANLAAAFTQVDRVEGFGATEGQLKAFQIAGKLTPR